VCAECGGLSARTLIFTAHGKLLLSSTATTVYLQYLTYHTCELRYTKHINDYQTGLCNMLWLAFPRSRIATDLLAVLWLLGRFWDLRLA